MSTLTLLHVLISLIAIGAGFVLIAGLLASRTSSAVAASFLGTTFATALTGFLFFPLAPVLPSHIVGLVLLVAVALAAYAFYGRRFAGSWRWIWVVASVTSLYLNVFVGVVQAFLQVPALNALAPTQSEPPFLLAQTAVLVLFIALGAAGVVRFRPVVTPTPRQSLSA